MAEKEHIDPNDWFRGLGQRHREPADPTDGNAWFRSIGRSGGLIKPDEPAQAEAEGENE